MREVSLAELARRGSPDRVALLSIWFHGHNNPRYAELLPRLEFIEPGGARLRELTLGVRPRWLAIVGITAYRVAFDAPRAAVGPQQATISDARDWLLPNPSGLNAHWQLPELAAEFARLRVAAVA